MSSAYTFNDDDVIAPEVYGRVGHPHQAFAWLRSHDPLRLVKPNGFRPFWAVTKHADIQRVAKQPVRYSNAHGLIIMPQGAPGQPAEMVVTMDPPRHGPMRNVAIPPRTSPQAACCPTVSPGGSTMWA